MSHAALYVEDPREDSTRIESGKFRLTSGLRDPEALGREMGLILQSFLIADRHFHEPASRAADFLELRFQALAAKWKQDTQFVSSTTEIAMHPAYQRIIGMGRAALPLILDDLRRQPEHWFWALSAIANEDPVPAEYRGQMQRMRECWLEWGKRRGLRGDVD